MMLAAPAAAAIVTTVIESPLGPLTGGATDDGVCLLAFPARSADEIDGVRRRLGTGTRSGDHPHLARLRDELAAYFAGALTRFTVPVHAAGTPFQQRVWAQLLRIPYGATWSYEQLAREVGVGDGQRAVGHANGRNPVAIVIPCHRVINKNGKLGGYGGELWRKQTLLALESGTPRLTFPA
jgi:AraC family transcriptional regulator of adaptative response/methylated-DNA-[protein]-cysteine methyltransferase